MPEPVDILFVSPGVTAGWRQADLSLAEALRNCGTSVVEARPSYRLAGHLRRGELATDLAEAAALRHATSKALGAYDPRAFLFSSVQAAMLQPRSRLERSAIRFDAPPTLNRSGFGSGALHRLERRALAAVRLLLPYGLGEVEQANVPLPVPIDPFDRDSRREPIAIAYAGNPQKKGLELLVRVWSEHSPDGMRLIVTGIEPEHGRAFLHGRNAPEPESIEWTGLLDRDQFRELLSRAQLYLSASRFEDYGQAQLEALAAGCLLVTTPSPGPYEALRIARVLMPALVSDDLSAALGAAANIAPAELGIYRARARELTARYSYEELEQRLRASVLPQLLG